MNPTKISTAKLKTSSEHVFYEIWMFLAVIKELAIMPQTPQNSFCKNVCLDCFVIHLRNLLNFFYVPSKNRKKDDILAEDFLKDIKIFKIKRTRYSQLSYTKIRIDKQVAHLTYHRSRYNKRTKPWQFGKLHSQLYPTIVAFYECLPISFRNWFYFKELKKVIDIFQNI